MHVLLLRVVVSSRLLVYLLYCRVFSRFRAAWDCTVHFACFYSILSSKSHFLFSKFSNIFLLSMSVNDNSCYGFPDVLTNIFTNFILILFSFHASAYVCVSVQEFAGVVRIIASLSGQGWKEPLEFILSNHLAQDRTMSRWLLNMSKDGESTNYLISLFQFDVLAQFRDKLKLHKHPCFFLYNNSENKTWSGTSSLHGSDLPCCSF